jgi:hypothetical protein
MIVVLLGLARSLTLRPTEIYNTEFNITFGTNVTLKIDFADLDPPSVYELRVSWPGTCPVKIHFAAEGAIDVADEKVVMQSASSESGGTIAIEGIGLSRDRDVSYLVRLNISLEKQHFGLTFHVWKLICFMIPTALFANCLVLSVFPN